MRVIKAFKSVHTDIIQISYVKSIYINKERLELYVMKIQIKISE